MKWQRMAIGIYFNRTTEIVKLLFVRDSKRDLHLSDIISDGILTRC